MQKCSCGRMFSSHSSGYLEVKFLCDGKCMFSLYKKLLECFPECLYYFVCPAEMCEGSSAPHPYQPFWQELKDLFDVSSSSDCVVIISLRF